MRKLLVPNIEVRVIILASHGAYKLNEAQGDRELTRLRDQGAQSVPEDRGIKYQIKFKLCYRNEVKI